MYAPYGPFFAWFPETLPRNVAGGAIALINSCGALGGFVGAYLVGWLNAATGSPSLSYLMMAGSLLVSGLITLGVASPTRERVATGGAAVQSSVAE
jgi:nitrate/nitrite transporter NarK